MRRSVLGGLLLALSVAAAGCFGGGPSQTSNQNTTTSKTSLSGQAKISKSTPGFSGQSLSASGLRASSVADMEAPFSGATLLLYKVGPDGSLVGPLGAQATAGADGRFTMTGLPDPAPGDKYVLVAQKSVGGKTVKLEVQVPSLTKDGSTTQDVDPVLAFAKDVTESILKSLNSLWWSLDAAAIENMRTTVVSGIEQVVQTSGGLPDMSDDAAVRAVFDDIVNYVNNDPAARGAFADVVTSGVAIVTIAADGNFHEVVSDPAGDDDANLFPGEVSPGIDLTGVDLAASDTAYKVRIHFAAWPVEDKLAASMENQPILSAIFNADLRGYDATPVTNVTGYPAGTFSLNAWNGGAQALVEGGMFLGDGEVGIERDADAKTLTYTINRQPYGIDLDFAGANGAKGLALSVIAGSDYTQDVYVQLAL